MKKDRVAAFTDAVLAIIMTILVLELEKPSALTISAFWDLRHSFFSYALSFFWLGSMWINIHNEWESVEKINQCSSCSSIFDGGNPGNEAGLGSYVI